MKNTWNGFDSEEFLFEDHKATLVFPKEKPNGRLAVKTEYRDAFPNAAEIPLLENGFHLCFLENDNRWGTEPDLERKARFVHYLCEKYALSSRTVPVGMSCGGLIAVKFAAIHPELIGCLYLDAPVINYMSCPCGFGRGTVLGDDTKYTEILTALGLDTLAELMAYRDMPLDHLQDLIDAKIPVVLVVGDSDHVVPYAENGIFLERAYRKAGMEIEVYVKPGCDHHPHGLEDPKPVVDFILRHV